MLYQNAGKTILNKNENISSEMELIHNIENTIQNKIKNNHLYWVLINRYVNIPTCIKKGIWLPFIERLWVSIFLCCYTI